MNTKVNVRARLLFISRTFVTFLFGIVVVLVLSGPSVPAQTTATANTDPVDSSITISTTGTISNPAGAIKVSGKVIVTCRRVIDNTTAAAAPLVMLDFDFSELKGTTGTGKTTKTYVTGGNHATELRPLQASDTIVVTVPYFESTKDELSASSFMVTANLNFDIATGKLTSGSLVYGTNVFTSNVGTFTVVN